MKVLIACEESQRVCIAFRERSHEAYSCDIIEPSGEHPEWHIMQDVIPLLNAERGCKFRTMDGKEHYIDRWDLIIAFPPCTYLSNAGACRMYPTKGDIDKERFRKAMAAKDFFMKIYNCDCDKICIENPMPLSVVNLPEKSQVVQPYMFGEPWSKKTYLWLKGLPQLNPTKIIYDYKPYISCGTSKNKGNKNKSGACRAGGSQKARSKTFPGIAKAMAEQWG